MTRALWLAAVVILAGTRATAQLPIGDNQRCRVQILAVGDSGRSVNSGEAYYAGGGVRLKCLGQNITMASDSVIAHGSGDVDFIGRMRYRDSTVAVDADRVTYRKVGERWEARGNVVSRSLTSGSTIRAPALDYLRRVGGVRDTFEVFATGRPQVEYFSHDSAARNPEPYVIVADRLHAIGEDRVWGGGRVAIDRSDLAARADSLRLDTGAGNDGTLLGKPIFRGLGTDSFSISGSRIDFRLQGRNVRSVLATDRAHAVRGEWDLVADTIDLAVRQQKVELMLAWGRTARPIVKGTRYEVRGDSLALDTPAQQLTEARIFGAGWVGGDIDSLSQNRDWMAADTIVASFAQRDSAGKARTALNTVHALHAARSFHVAKSDKPGKRPSLSYARGDTITVTMKPTGDEGVARVDVRGHADGVQLEDGASAPVAAPPLGRGGARP